MRRPGRQAFAMQGTGNERAAATRGRSMATGTINPNHLLISSEDVEGTNVYDMNGTKIGEIDHLMI
jgi:hypothetical protein